MKIIKYKFLSAEINHGTEEQPDMERIFLEKTIEWSESNEAIAKREAYDGEYTIEDDGIPEPEKEQNAEERIAALEEQLAAAKILLGVE